jgi:invasion protein IalB
MDFQASGSTIGAEIASPRRPAFLVPVLLAVLVLLLLLCIGIGVGIYTKAISLPGLGGTPTALTETAAAPAASVLVAADTGAATPAGSSAAPAGTAAAAPTTAPAAPKLVRQETYGDWMLNCLQPSGSTTASCSIMQQLVDNKSGAPVFVWRLVQDGKGGLSAVWQAPEMVLLTRGITIDAGTPKPIVVPYQSCGNGSCSAVAGLDAGFVETLQKAAKIQASIVLTNGRELAFPISPKGLVDAIAALNK